MELRNVHFTAPLDDEPTPAPTVDSIVATLPEKMRLRKVAVSPLEEYARREGSVRPISDALAACILSIKGRVEINQKGARIDRKEIGGVRVYWHLDSRICADLSSREKKWFYVLNRHLPDRIHILDEHGRYIETLPQKSMPAALDNAAQAAAAADDKRAFRRAADHLQRLHGEDTTEKLEELRHNREIATRYVQTLDAPAAVDRQPAAQPIEGGTADRIQRADRQLDQAIGRHRSAVDLGRALNASRVPSPAAEEVPAEDWSNTRHTDFAATAPDPDIESW
jgi:hypothetical protein